MLTCMIPKATSSRSRSRWCRPAPERQNSFQARSRASPCAREQASQALENRHGDACSAFLEQIIVRNIAVADRETPGVWRLFFSIDLTRLCAYNGGIWEREVNRADERRRNRAAQTPARSADYDQDPFSLVVSGFFVCRGLCYNRRALFLDTDQHG